MPCSEKTGIAVALLGLFVLSLLGVQLNAKADHPSVYVIPVEKNVEQGLASFYRVLSKKRRSPARHTLFLTSIHREAPFNQP